eukprot:SAG31_NODE_4104_length_3579_cov_2.748851_2_plen_156_part_00
MVATLRRNGSARCAATPANQMSVEEMVDQDLDFEVDAAFVEPTSLPQLDSLVSADERSRRREVDDGVRRRSDATEDFAPEDCEEVRTATAAVPTRMHIEGGADYNERDDGPGRKAIGRGRGAQTKQETQAQAQVAGRRRGRGRGRLNRSQIRVSP